MNSAAFVNGRLADNLPLATIADQMNFPIVSSWMMGDLTAKWYPSSVTATIDNARSIIGPMVDQLKVHPSMRGYNVLDDANTALEKKAQLAVQVFTEHDPAHAASPTYVWGSLGSSVYDYVQSPAFLGYDYPAHINDSQCGWVSRWLGEVRQMISTKPASVPWWMVLQTHQTSTGPGDTDTSHLRYPSVEELRLQNWIALGEGARAIYWFLYSSTPEWTGFSKMPALYAELSSLGARDASLPLLALSKQANHFTSSGYTSTLRDANGNWYAIVANTSCSSAPLSVTSDLGGRLKNLETGQIVNQGSSMTFRGGDGALFQLVP